MTKQEFVTKMAAMAVLKEAMESLGDAVEAIENFAEVHGIDLEEKEDATECCNECRRGVAFQELLVKTSEATGLREGLVAEVLKVALGILEEKSEEE